jgi:hypothetical protein
MSRRKGRRGLRSEGTWLNDRKDMIGEVGDGNWVSEYWTVDLERYCYIDDCSSRCALPHNNTGLARQLPLQ